MKQEQKRHDTTPLKLLIAVLVAIAIAILAGGCKAKVLTKTEYRDRVEYRDRLIVDSVYNRDTVHLYRQGDTVFRDVIKWRERWRIKADSIYIHKTDSISVPKLVPAELTTWQRVRLSTWGWMLLAALALAVWILKPWRWKSF